METNKRSLDKTKKGFTLIELIIVIAIIGILSAIVIPTWSYFVSQSRIRSQNSNSKIIFNVAQTECIKQGFSDRGNVNGLTILQDSYDDAIKKLNTSTPEHVQYVADQKVVGESEWLTNVWEKKSESERNAYSNKQMEQEKETYANNYVQSKLADLQKFVDEDFPKQKAELAAKIYLANTDEGTQNKNEVLDFYFYWDGEKGYACDVNGKTFGKAKLLDDSFAERINQSVDNPKDTVYRIHIVDYKVAAVVSGRFESDPCLGSYPVQATKRSKDDILKVDMSKIAIS